MNTDNIDPEKYYSSLSISKMNILPWRSPFTFNLKLNNEKWKYVFKPLIEQNGKNKTYRVQGRNIIKFIEDLEKGDIKI